MFPFPLLTVIYVHFGSSPFSIDDVNWVGLQRKWRFLHTRTWIKPDFHHRRLLPIAIIESRTLTKQFTASVAPIGLYIDAHIPRGYFRANWNHSREEQPRVRLRALILQITPPALCPSTAFELNWDFDLVNKWYLPSGILVDDYGLV